MKQFLAMIYEGNDEVVSTWDSPFVLGIPCIPWNTFVDKFLPPAVKMAGLTCTMTSRCAGARILRAAAHVAAKNGRLEGTLLHSYLALCEDPVISIRRESLEDLRVLISQLPLEVAASHFFPEVSSRYN